MWVPCEWYVSDMLVLCWCDVDVKLGLYWYLAGVALLLHSCCIGFLIMVMVMVMVLVMVMVMVTMCEKCYVRVELLLDWCYFVECWIYAHLILILFSSNVHVISVLCSCYVAAMMGSFWCLVIAALRCVAIEFVLSFVLYLNCIGIGLMLCWC
jgi:hypothetical protein